MNPPRVTRPSLLLALPAVIMFGMLFAGCTTQTGTTSGNSSTIYSASGKTVVYFNNTALNPNADCGLVYPVSRDVSSKPYQPFALLQELVSGPSDAEKTQGYTSFFSPLTADSVISLNVEDGTAYINLRDIRSTIPNASSSCGSTSLVAEIENTLKQFPEITRVIIAINSSTKTFYDWIQIGCGPINDDCDDVPFKSGQSMSL